MKLTFCLLIMLWAFSASAGEPPWWTQQKINCGLPPSLPYNTWVAQGMPCHRSGGQATSSETQRPDWVPNKRSKDHPNIVSSDNEGNWRPADGYNWVVDPPVRGDFRVEWIPNRRSRDHPHVVSGGEEDTWNPEDGYSWLHEFRANTDFHVRWVPNQLSNIYPHIVSSDDEGNWHPEAGYKWVINPPQSGDLRVIDNGQVETAIRTTPVVLSLTEQKNRLQELSRLQQYDRVEAALNILATRWLITMPSAQSAAQREILIQRTKAELKALLGQVLHASINQMSNDVKNLTPFVWDPFAADKRQALARMDREILNLKGRAEFEIRGEDIFREIQSGSSRSALQYNSGEALQQLLEINNKRSWAK